MSKLDPRLETIRETYGLNADDFWQLPQNKGTWLIKHSALEVVAAKAGVKFDPPTIIEARSGDGIASIVVTGHWQDRTVWSFGEASPKNSKTAYPWSIAEKRAIDRVVLKLIGIHGLVYSEDEMSDVEQPKAQSRGNYAELQTEIDACMSIDDLDTLWRSKPFQAEYNKLPNDWRPLLDGRRKEREAELRGERPTGPAHQNMSASTGGEPGSSTTGAAIRDRLDESVCGPLLNRLKVQLQEAANAGLKGLQDEWAKALPDIKRLPIERERQIIDLKEELKSALVSKA